MFPWEITYIIFLRCYICYIPLIDLVIKKALYARHCCLFICKADTHWAVWVKSSKILLAHSLTLEKITLPSFPKTLPLLCYHTAHSFSLSLSLSLAICEELRGHAEEPHVVRNYGQPLGAYDILGQQPVRSPQT